MKAVFGPHDRETSATGSVFAHLWNESNRLGDHTRREKEEMLKIGIIVGSTRPGRKAAAVAKWVHDILKSRKDAEF